MFKIANVSDESLPPSARDTFTRTLYEMIYFNGRVWPSEEIIHTQGKEDRMIPDSGLERHKEYQHTSTSSGINTPESLPSEYHRDMKEAGIPIKWGTVMGSDSEQVLYVRTLDLIDAYSYPKARRIDYEMLAKVHVRNTLQISMWTHWQLAPYCEDANDIPELTLEDMDNSGSNITALPSEILLEILTALYPTAAFTTDVTKTLNMTCLFGGDEDVFSCALTCKRLQAVAKTVLEKHMDVVKDCGDSDRVRQSWVGVKRWRVDRWQQCFAKAMDERDAWMAGSGRGPCTGA